jgi:hypothetical protein
MKTNTPSRPLTTRANSMQLKNNKKDIKPKLTTKQAILPKSSNTSLRNLPPRDPNFKRSSDLRANSPAEQINKLLEEGKVREEWLKKRLEVLKERAKLAVSKCQTKTNEEGSDIASKLLQYNTEINNVRHEVDSILQVTKETQSEVQKTKDLVANIDSSQCKFGGSFQSRFAEDEDAEMFKGSLLKFELERTGAAQQSPLITVNDDEGISNFVCLMKNMLLPMEI